MTPLPLAPGYVLAQRYRLVDLVGRARIGDVWRAHDLVLQIVVAVKVAYPADDKAKQQILKSFRLARQITHPAVRRVFDAGEIGACVYYTMEFVPGEDLGTLLRRSGRLTSERVLEIGRQLCDGLSAAHAQGLLHGDLRPANVLVDDAGGIHITDFEAQGTEDIPSSEYMAPEYRKRASAASERSDVYSVGVILYELLTGELPRATPGRAPRKPSAMVGDVDSLLESTILRALSADPHGRPATAAIMASQLVPAHDGWSRWRQGLGPVVTALAVIVIVLAGLIWWRWPDPGPRLTPQDTIVLADVVNTTGEPVFDRALKVALAVALEQSPFLRIFPDAQVRETLRLMQRDPDLTITRDVAREIARRERLKAFVAGSIGAIGSRYVLTLEVINAETGALMAQQQVEAAAREDVLTALGTAASSLRERLGESLASVDRYDVPLPRATTASLEALHAYALALDEGRLLPRVEAIPHLKRAIEIDPDFAMAHALLSGAYANTGSYAEAPAHARRAFELRDRVNERERFFISWRYYIDAEQAWDEALALARSWTTTYPRDAFAFNSLGLALAAFGEHAPAVAAFRHANELDFRFVPPHGNLAGSLIALDRYAEAKAVLDEADERRISQITRRRLSHILAFIAGDRPAMARQVEPLRGTPDEMWTTIWEGRAAVFEGRLRDAHALYRAGAAAARQASLPALSAQWLLEDAEAHALSGQCRAAAGEIGAAETVSRDNFTLERAGRALAICGDAGAAAGIASELGRRFPRATLTTRLHIPVIEAAVAVRQGNAARALELLERVKPFDGAPSAEFWPRYLRGQAYAVAGNPAAAEAEFKTILNHRGEAPVSMLYPLAWLGVARASAARGDTSAARTAYDALFDLWRTADANVDALVRARAEDTRIK